MSHRVCPWWVGYLLINPLRRFAHDPRRILGDQVREGMAVLEPGPGMGFFTLEMARRVGPSGRVVAVDVQPRMLDKLKRRAARAGLAERIECRLAGPESLGVGEYAGRIDFALVFAVAHEVPDQRKLFQEVAAALKPGARCLLVEPSGHVSREAFEQTIGLAGEARLVIEAEPHVSRSRAALLWKSPA